MRKHRGLVAVLALTMALLVGGTGCGLLPGDGCNPPPQRPDRLSPQDLVGDYSGDPFGEVRLEEDGTLRVTNWRGEVPDRYRRDQTSRKREEKRSRAGIGEWRVLPATERDVDVQLAFYELDGVVERGDPPRTHGLRVGGNLSAPMLYQYPWEVDTCQYPTLTKVS
ncbi:MULTISPECIES: hypothetical protein [Streptomyces]|uniref:hypothetical protein n=1 Tax=Streptomyces TaxID=1883 RepID=UPI000CD5243A|nr:MULTISPECIES: hypothetical protein [Streptomyces]